ncbi:MAG TPA: MoaD/ThiS family protein [Gemmatimonadales bacterium]
MTIHLPSQLARLADGKRSISAGGATVGEAVEQAAAAYPALGPRLRDERGAPYPFVTFYLNDEDIRLAGGFARTIADGDELIVVPAVAGG